MSALRDRQIFFETLHRITDLMTGDRDLDRIYASILDCAIQVLGGEAAILSMLEDGRPARLVRRRAQMGHGATLEKLSGLPGGLVGAVLKSGRPLTASPAAEHPAFEAGQDQPLGIRIKNFVGVPYTGRGDERGVLAVVNSLRFDDSLSEEMDILSVLANQSAVASENFKLYKRLEQLAITDELTQVYNYRFLKTALKKEIKRSARLGLQFSILMIDLDNLKRYNEVNGHLGGSGLLKSVATILVRNARDMDLVAKYGGDEFMIILPQTSLSGAEIMARRVRQAVADAAFTNAPKGQITVSIGVAAFPVNGQTVEELIAGADQALYQAKRAGRNQVILAGPLAA